MTSCPPYRPVRGAQPPHFVDRPPADAVDGTGLVTAALAGLRNGPNDPRCHQLVTAGPAMGKTAFACQLLARARDELGWCCVLYPCRPKQAVLGTLADMIARAVGRAALAGRRAPGSDDAVCLCRRQHPAGRHLRPVPPCVVPGAERSWDHLCEVVVKAGRDLAAAGRGLVIAVDDAHHLARGEGEALVYLEGTLRAQALPVAIFLTALETGGAPAEGRAGLGGPLWHERLVAMETEESAEALVVPAALRGTTFEPAALDAMCEFASGSPLAVQQAGFAVWSAAGGRGTVTAGVARRALELLSAGDQGAGTGEARAS